MPISGDLPDSLDQLYASYLFQSDKELPVEDRKGRSKMISVAYLSEWIGKTMNQISYAMEERAKKLSKKSMERAKCAENARRIKEKVARTYDELRAKMVGEGAQQQTQVRVTRNRKQSEKGIDIVFRWIFNSKNSLVCEET